ncbi:MAG: alanine racemase [Acidobacteriota bacterium]
MRIDEIPTPALLVEHQVLVQNLDRLADHCRRLGVSLRPHVKTHKCLEVARLQVERGACGLTVSTLAEAHVFCAAGFRDLTLAVPLIPAKIPAALELARRARLGVLVDDEQVFSRLQQAAAAAETRVHAWLKIDCGYHRAGLEPGDPVAVSLARRMASSSSVSFEGLLTHAGHSYRAAGNPRRLQIAEEERDAVVVLARRLKQEAGVPVPQVSVGSTPTVTIAKDLTGVTEARPGNYAFFDLTQAALGSCRVEEIAVSVLASVISHPLGAGRAVLDAGALALSKDPGPGSGRKGSPSMGGVCPEPETTRIDPSLRLGPLSQEHGVVCPLQPGGLRNRLPVGSRVRILPNHSCLAAACFDELYVMNGGQVMDRWVVHRERSVRGWNR